MKTIQWILAVILAAGQFSSGEASPVHRWSFNHGAGAASSGASIVDSVSGADGVVVGNDGMFTGSALMLPGSTNGNHSPANIAAYVDLPNGLISSKSDLTIEVWATMLSNKNWQRLFDFGKMNVTGMGAGAAEGEITPGATSAPGGTSSTDNLMLAINRGTSANTQRFTARTGGAGEVFVDSGAVITPGEPYHFAIVVEEGAGSSGAGGSQMRWYLNGALVETRDLDFHLRDIEDVNNWIGRSQYSGDNQSHVEYDEFRIYDHVLTPREIGDSWLAGPDFVFPPPETEPDVAVLNPGGKVRIPVLENDAGYLASTIEVVGFPAFGNATVAGGGQILYSHDEGDPESDSFTYRVRGAGGYSAAETVTVMFSDELRLSNPMLNVPGAPPPMTYQIVNAFPGVTFDQPICFATPPGETQRLFVCEKEGRIQLIPDLNAPSTVEFLDLASSVAANGESLQTSSEQGLLGLAFHPDYASNGYFYVYYSVRSGGRNYQRVSRFAVQANDPNAADPDSEKVLFEQVDSAGNHNGGDLHFGPDGYLYISLGDGGDANDTQGHSQKIDGGFFAAVARIDVDRKPGNLEPNAFAGVPLYDGVAAYSIPADNPYVGATSFNGSSVDPDSVRTELWAVGLRNPWRMSFDPETGELWAGDVGQGRREEINILTSGGNYGWAYREGTLSGPRAAPPRFSSVAPIYEYARGSGEFEGNSVTGGVVYRGSGIPNLEGSYIFGDYVSGNIWALQREGSDVSVERIAGQGSIVAFGTDPSNGDVLMADLSGGRVMRLTAGTPAGAYPLTLTETGLFADVSALAPAPGLVSYEPNLSFWSDHAIKRRWFILPDETSAGMTWANDDLWTFPEGQIWVKHFDMEMEEGNPASRRRLETRLLVHGEDEFYGVSYQWNEDQTDATLVPAAGASLDLAVTTADGVRHQTWQIPSRTSCMACHTPQAGYALSFTTRQLNGEGTVAHMVGNQLELLHEAGYFANTPDPVETLPHHVRPDETEFSLEARVRSYLEVNCVSCHTPGGSGGSTWDSRAATPLFQTGLIHGTANNNGGDPANKLVVPGDPEHSILLSRVAASNGFTRMPPIATNELDEAGIALLTEWIATYGAERMSFEDWQALHFGSASEPTAAPSADPDGDGRTNREEYLRGTLPHATTATSGLTVDLSTDGSATVNFTDSPNAVGRVLYSTNLTDWLLWNVSGNDGLPRADEMRSLQGEIDVDAAFFKLLLEER